ncbi:hypothetical protein Pelo_1699 [Pelomyxa schiedti]|nr:hypothetical protein Pelo_1699 [Pelomyxa schiedti]
MLVCRAWGEAIRGIMGEICHALCRAKYLLCPRCLPPAFPSWGHLYRSKTAPSVTGVRVANLELNGATSFSEFISQTARALSNLPRLPATLVNIRESLAQVHGLIKRLELVEDTGEYNKICQGLSDTLWMSVHAKTFNPEEPKLRKLFALLVLFFIATTSAPVVRFSFPMLRNACSQSDTMEMSVFSNMNLKENADMQLLTSSTILQIFLKNTRTGTNIATTHMLNCYDMHTMEFYCSYLLRYLQSGSGPSLEAANKKCLVALSRALRTDDHVTPQILETLQSKFSSTGWARGFVTACYTIAKFEAPQAVRFVSSISTLLHSCITLPQLNNDQWWLAFSCLQFLSLYAGEGEDCTCLFECGTIETSLLHLCTHARLLHSKHNDPGRKREPFYLPAAAFCEAGPLFSAFGAQGSPLQTDTAETALFLISQGDHNEKNKVLQTLVAFPGFYDLVTTSALDCSALQVALGSRSP